MSVSYLFPRSEKLAGVLSEDVADVPAPVGDYCRQLELDFGGSALRLLKIAVTDTIHGGRLTALIDELTPEFVIDLRNVLRFDLPGMSRESFFHRLSARGVHYARAPIAWNDICSYGITARIDLPVRLYHEAVERWGGNLVLLVSRHEHAAHTHAMLNLALSSHRTQGWSIEQVV